jgi:hypothetical protein
MSVTLDWNSAPFVRCGTSVATLVARNMNEAIVAPKLGLVDPLFVGNLESGGRFSFGAFGISRS